MDDPSGYLPRFAKIALGAGIIAGLALATVVTGGAAAGVAGFIVSGALNGAITGAAIGTTIGAIKGYANGGWEGLKDGASSGFMNGAISGAITGAVANTARVANAARAWDYSKAGSSYKNMVSHYKKHVLGEGKKSVAKNIVKYTNDAKKLWKSSGGVGKPMSSGSIKIKSSGMGGFYSPNGAIRSFFY